MSVHRQADLNSILTRFGDVRTLDDGDCLRLFQIQGGPELSALQETVQACYPMTGSVPFAAQMPLFLTKQSELMPNAAWNLQNTLYEYTIDDIDQRLEQAVRDGFDTAWVVAGFWSALQLRGLGGASLLQTHRNLLRHIQRHYPSLGVQGYSPDEIDFLQVLSGRSSAYLLGFLKDHGVTALSGHEAGLLVDDYRLGRSPKFMRVKDWWLIQAQAQRLGLKAQLSMTIGEGESLAQRLQHLRRAAVWIAEHPDAILPFVLYPSSAGHDAFWNPEERLKILAICRMILPDVLPALQTYWLAGEERAAMAETRAGLVWGANHWGSTADGAYARFLAGSRDTQPLSRQEMQALCLDKV